MKILELTLTNFLPILSGMGKYSITLDLRNSNDLISVFIGKIGSGKTYILSHLQPFSTVGTLDVRNQDDPIIPEKDGKKVIVYMKDNHEYVITHDYIWTGKTHSKKSYIEKDGVELNENGNSSSFKEIIQIEFGIDQGFLRLLRLGPNVTNFIKMKATERKSYVASLLDSTEVYLLLYKHWSADLRTLNTKASILMNKLNSFGNETLDEIQDQITLLEDDIKEYSNFIDNKMKTKYVLHAENNAYLDNMSYDQFKLEESRLISDIPSIEFEIQSIKDLLVSFDKYPNILDVNKEIGKLDQLLTSQQEQIQKMNDTYTQVSSDLNNLKDRKTMMFNQSHMDTLQETYEDLMKQDKRYKEELQGFKCDYSSTFLSGFLGDLNTLNVLINEISQYDKDMICTLYQSDSSVINYAQKKIEILGYRKLKLQKMINNLKFSETYEPTSPLYFPPFCPTHQCPYYKTHPVTLQKNNPKKDDIQEQLIAYQNEIKDLDIEIYKYSDYSLVYSKISALKGYWKKSYPILSSLKALNCESLLHIISRNQYQLWYNYDKIINTIELLEKRDRYFELTEKIKTIKNEINELSLDDNADIDKEIARLESEKNQLEVNIEKGETEYKETEQKLKDFNQMYLDLSEKSIHEESLRKLSEQLSSSCDRLRTIQLNDQKIADNISKIQSIDLEIADMKSKVKGCSEKLDSLKTKMNDMQYTNKELDQVLTEQKYMTYMVNAVSAKKGIPLVMIQVFLDSCRDIVNSLIYDVCEDELEILPFQIDETEFKIPYIVNGQRIDDISKASQGQTSIVETAMAFALIQQTESTEYNIPLFDEMDAPLHKNDKQKFIAILLKHLKKIGSEQCFVITHDDNTFDSYPVQVIMTTDEIVNEEKYTNIIKL